MFSRVLVVVAALCLGGCAAKQFAEIPISQPGDDQLSCSDIRKEIDANATAQAVFVHKDKQVEAGNTAKTVASATPFVGPLIAGTMDLSNEEQVKARALADRNERLSYLAKQKGCVK
jgi:hypothetical protein